MGHVSVKHFLQIAAGVDTMPLLLELHRQPHLWNRNDARLSENGPHYQTQDIWLRYKDETENKRSGSYADFGDPHDGVWYPAFYALPSARKIIFDLMRRVEGERLGGVLLYKVPAGKRILPHTDTGWHVDYYDKFNICLQSNRAAAFCYHDGEKMYQEPGDVHHFANNVEHLVTNEGEDDHIVLTICIRTHYYGTRFKEETAYGDGISQSRVPA